MGNTKILSEKKRILYNNIKLPSCWPPKQTKFTYEVPKVPYLLSPPKIINIKIGRQLFVDDFLIERTSLKREFHQAKYYGENPVFSPLGELEETHKPQNRGPFAAPFSGGIWYNPFRGRFEMWYMPGYVREGNGYGTAFAYSDDGLVWTRPKLKNNTNLVHEENAICVWLDLEEKNPDRRFKMTYNLPGKDLLKEDQKWYGTLDSMVQAFSPDGIMWSKAISRTGPTGDRNALFYNPFRKVWCFSIRACEPYGPFKGSRRIRRYWESADLIKNLPWSYQEPLPWTAPDKLDKGMDNSLCELYNLDAVAYESLIIGLFNINRKDPDNSKKDNAPKLNEIALGFTRDGFHWDRPNRESFLRVSEDKEAWNNGNLQSVGGCCLVVKDKLYFYLSGRRNSLPLNEHITTTGLAFLRRDGFASMNATKEMGTLTTKRLKFNGCYFFLNADAENGEILVEILDEKEKVIEPFSVRNCIPISANDTCHRVIWKDNPNAAFLKDKIIRIKFYVRNSKLYSFWITPDKQGASYGYVAAGGPGFSKATDTVGLRIF